ncbi:hypothetical protein ACIRP3_01175 [Streptomyces sp. NPDC101209]|uniref:hypothetical protein n=1 Tax=Streptomyces sp. NPDC101209 TaxID=3366129 RepID=UPI00380309A6
MIAALLLGASTAHQVMSHASGSPVRGITGCLDLSDAELRQALRIEECWFEKAPKFHGASTRMTRIVDSWLPGVNAGLAHVEGHLDLSRSRMEGCFDLLNASVAGELMQGRQSPPSRRSGSAARRRGPATDTVTVAAQAKCR